MGVTIATTRVACNTGTGNQDIGTNDLAGLTPKAVLLICTRATADATAVDGAGLYVGASDGTNEWTTSYEDQHLQATIDPQNDQDTTANRILTIYDGTGDSVVEATANFSAFIPNGVTINWTDAPAAAYLLTAIFFAGSDLSANVGSQDLGNTSDAAIDITTVGFEADDVLTFLLRSSSSNVTFSAGVVHNNRAGTVTQRSACIASRGFSSAQMGTLVREDACLTRLINGGQSGLDYTVAAGSFDSSGFTAQLGNARPPSNDDIGWIALRYGSSPVISSKVYTFSSPTGTGSLTDSGAGFTPQFIFYLPTFCAVAGTIELDADAGSFAMSAIDGDEAYSNSVSCEDGAADSNTQSFTDNKAINLPTYTGGTGIEADFTSFGGTGVTLNFTAFNATARLFPAIAFGANATSPLTYTVAASSDDGHEHGSTSTITEQWVEAGNHSQALTGACRFLSVAIAQGATITSAILSMTAQASYSTANTISVIAYAEDVDDAATLTTAEDNIEGRTRTTANSGAKNIQSVTLNAVYTWDVTTAVQEVINRGGWASGNDLCILLVDNSSTTDEWQSFWSYDGDTAKAPRLDIIVSTKSLPIFSRHTARVWHRRF